MSTFWTIFICIYVFMTVMNLYNKMQRIMLGVDKENKQIYERLVERIGIGTSLLIGLIGIVIMFIMVYILTYIIVWIIGV